MFYNLRERSALRIRNTGKEVIEALSDVPFKASQVKEKLLDLVKLPGEYLFLGYNVGDIVSVMMGDKEVWYKIDNRYIDTDTKKLTYDAILVSNLLGPYGRFPIRISVYHERIRRKDQ